MLKRPQILESVIDTLMPITEAKVLQVDGALGVSLNNAGDSTVTINNVWTMLPGATLQLASPTPMVVVNCSLTIKFTGGTTNRLEIMEQRIKSPAFSNFTKDGTAD